MVVSDETPVMNSNSSVQDPQKMPPFNKYLYFIFNNKLSLGILAKQRIGVAPRKLVSPFRKFWVCFDEMSFFCNGPLLLIFDEGGDEKYSLTSLFTGPLGNDDKNFVLKTPPAFNMA